MLTLQTVSRGLNSRAMNKELQERVQQNRQVYDSLQPGDVIEMDHEVKVGMTRWHTVTKGEVIKTNRQREGLHFRRNNDDDVFRDEIITKLEDGSTTTLTLDEYSVLKKIGSSAEPSRESAAPQVEAQKRDEEVEKAVETPEDAKPAEAKETEEQAADSEEKPATSS